MSAEKGIRAAPAHLAAGPALGYVYQFQVGLLRLLPHALRNEEVSLCFEVLDDVSLEYPKGSPPQVLQVHSESGNRPLTDRSSKVWKTLAIWAREWEQLDPGELREMILFSTQVAQEGSGVAALRRTDREPQRAADLLQQIAADPEGASGTTADRAVFLTLGEQERHALLRHVTVVDGATPPVAMHRQLVDELMPTNDARYIPSMAEMVEGWWWGRVPIALQSGNAIHAEELRAQIDEARRMHSTTALPVLELRGFGKEDLPDVDTQTARFLTCLSEISASQPRRAQAVDDYRLAFAHRSRWARRGLLNVGEAERYEANLLGNWLVGCDQMLRKLKDADDGEARASAGHDLWDEMEQAVYQPLRPETTNSFLQRGSLHQLADEQRLSWHPDSAKPIYQKVQPLSEGS